jgi:hypothetical protein
MDCYGLGLCRQELSAAKLLLEPVFEADFDPNAYGYRPKRSAQEAIQKVHKLLCTGYAHVVDADLSKYFDTIPHSELMQCVARRIVDRDMLRLIKMWLKVPIEERDENGKPRVSGGKGSTWSLYFDGLIGADVFQRFLIEIDFTRLQLRLEPYPEWRTSESNEVEDASSTLSAGFVRALRFGNHLTVPTSVNQKGAYLFLIDSGAFNNIIDNAVAEDSTKVYNDTHTVVQGVQGRVKEVGRASRITLAFAGFRQDNPSLMTISMGAE